VGGVTLKIGIFSEDSGLSNKLFTTLSDSQHFKSIEVYANLIKGFEAVKKEKHDIAFIDAREKEGPGVELAARLLELVPATKVVFIANDGRNAMEGFRLGILDYIVLPIGKDDIESLINNFKNIHRPTI
jgi:two-component SAPR family response regulator